jgi:5'-methylthioadenosine phosphorylase
MEGPLFSTRAESELYRSFGAGLINMSVLPEAKLAREAELCYAMICMVTDYDCWREGEDDVDIQTVIANLMRNADTARGVLQDLVPALVASDRTCACPNACEFAVITAPDQRDPDAVRKLSAVLPRYFG